MDKLDEMLLELVQDWFTFNDVMTQDNFDNLRMEVLQDEHDMLDDDLEELDDE
jgi:hypothetical protein